MLASIEQLPLVASCAALLYVSVIVLMCSAKARGYVSFLYELEPTSTRQHVLALDSLRGMAALMVAGLHTWQWPYPMHKQVSDFIPFITKGGNGVPVFAALSGFLIYRSLAGKTGTSGQLRHYFFRRFLRIYPLFAVTTIVVTLMGQMRHDPTVWHGLASELLMLEVFGYPHIANLPAWSIYPEALFYLLAPIIIIIAGRQILLVLSVIVISTVLLAHDASTPFQLIPFFAIGAISAELSARTAPIIARTGWGPYLLLFGGLAMICLVFAEIRPLDYAISCAGAWAGVPLPIDQVHGGMDLMVGLLMLLLALSAGSFPILNAHPIRFFGIISYSIYLWHSIILTANLPIRMDGWGKLVSNMPPDAKGGWFTYFGLFLPAIVFVSAVSYVVIERPFLRLRIQRSAEPVPSVVPNPLIVEPR